MGSGVADDEQARARAVAAAVEAAAGPTCRRCGVPLSRREIVVSHAMGFKHAPVGLACLAETLGHTPAELRREVHEVILRRACWLAGWERAVALDGPDADWDLPEPSGAAPVAPHESAPGVEADRVWDAGELSCGDLLFDLRLRIRELDPGQVLEVVARDLSAPIDLPAWCRLTGHPLVAAEHPRYWVRRRPA